MFHVPEQYRILNGRLASSSQRDGHNGAFEVPSRLISRTLFIIASDGSGCAEQGLPPWEHVSVHGEYGSASRPGKLFIPSWEEMCQVKDLFWDPEDVVMQLHPAQSEYVNHHRTTLHLWRPVGVDIPTPPHILVGLQPGEALHVRR